LKICSDGGHDGWMRIIERRNRSGTATRVSTQQPKYQKARAPASKRPKLLNSITIGLQGKHREEDGRRKKKVIPSARENKTKTTNPIYICPLFVFSSFLATEKKKKPEVPNGWRCCDETQVTHDDGHRVAAQHKRRIAEELRRGH
jgi:hypothetical protein